MTIGNADGTGGYDAPNPTLVAGSVASSDGAGFVKYPVEGFFIGPGDSGAARFGTGASPRLYQNSGYQASGWCQQCGRRRGADGRCANCDPWWTSPLLMVGVPSIAATCFGLFLLITALGGRQPRPVVVASNPAPPYSSAPVFSAPPSPGNPRQMASVLPGPLAQMPAPPVFSVPAFAPSGPVVTVGPLPTPQDRFLQRWAEQESLRQTSAFVDGAISEDARNRERAEAQARDAYFSSPAAVAPTLAVPGAAPRARSFPGRNQLAQPIMDDASI